MARASENSTSHLKRQLEEKSRGYIEHLQKRIQNMKGESKGVESYKKEKQDRLREQEEAREKYAAQKRKAPRRQEVKGYEEHLQKRKHRQQQELALQEKFAARQTEKRKLEKQFDLTRQADEFELRESMIRSRSSHTNTVGGSTGGSSSFEMNHTDSLAPGGGSDGWVPPLDIGDEPPPPLDMPPPPIPGYEGEEIPPPPDFQPLDSSGEIPPADF